MILHGTKGNSQENWFPWLAEELISRGWKTWVPDLPQADRPSIKRYNDFILRNPDWEFDSESIIVGHSSGAVAVLGLLQELPDKTKIDTCYLVGAFKDNLNWDTLDELFTVPFNYEKIRNGASKFIFIHSDNDPYCPLDHAKYLTQKLDGELIILKNQKHFSVSTSGKKYRKFPYLLRIINLKGT